MKAIVASHIGGPEVLQFVDVDEPTPSAGELLVAPAAIGVNFIEIYQRSGVYAVPFPFTPGSEVAGTVVGLGPGVTEFAIGDRVVTSMGRAAYAERCIVPVEQAVLVPDDVDLITAAAIAMQGGTAHYLTHSASHVEAGDTVLVHAGAGGVGQILIQLLAARGVRVIATASTQSKRDLCLNAGATHAIDYADFDATVRALTNGEGVAAVFDGVGIDTFDQSLASLRVRGELILFGGASGQVPPFDLQRLNSGGSLSVSRPSLIHFLRTPEERAWRYGDLFAALRDGSLRVQIGERFNLAEASAAQAELQSRMTTGKVLLIPSEEYA